MSLAIIGGSGIYNVDFIETLEKIHVETPIGDTSSDLVRAKIEGSEFYFLARHGEGHAVSPSEINYRANLYALKSKGVDTVVSVSAVGSLKEEIKPGDIVLPEQFIDWTKGLRKRSFFEGGVVGHVSVADPVNKDLMSRLFEHQNATKAKIHKGGTYVCIEGPQFSTKAESQMYRGLDASIIGMTNVPEAFLAKEAGMAYATIALVTDYDCWKDSNCSVEDIMAVLKDNVSNAHTLIKSFVPDLVKNPVAFDKENQYSIITKEEYIAEDKVEVLKVLLK